MGQQINKRELNLSERLTPGRRWIADQLYEMILRSGYRLTVAEWHAFYNGHEVQCVIAEDEDAFMRRPAEFVTKEQVLTALDDLYFVGVVDQDVRDISGTQQRTETIYFLDEDSVEGCARQLAAHGEAVQHRDRIERLRKAKLRQGQLLRGGRQ